MKPIHLILGELQPLKAKFVELADRPDNFLPITLSASDMVIILDSICDLCIAIRAITGVDDIPEAEKEWVIPVRPGERSSGSEPQG